LAQPSQATLDPRLSKLAANASDADIWFASVDPLSTLEPIGLSNSEGSPIAQGQVLQSVLCESGTARLSGESAQFTFNATTRSPQDANSLSDVIRFLVNMAETKAQNNPQAAVLTAAVVQNLQVNSNGSDVHVSATVPEQVLAEYLTSNTATR
jgi:hypothetical protein